MKNFLKSISLQLKSTLSELILYEASLDINENVLEIGKIFNQNPNLPAVLIFDGNNFVGIITRKQYHEALSKPFWLDVFYKREIYELYEQLDKNEILILPSSMDITTAVQQFLSRDKSTFDDPIIVLFGENKYKILDSYFLLLAHSEINKIALKALKEANEMKTELLSIAAHDLKNPLNNIIALTKIAKADIKSNASFVEEALTQIDAIASNMFNLIVELLSANVIESGKMHLKKQLIDITEIIDAILFQCKISAENKQQEISFQVDRDIPFIVNADPIKIREAFENIISNALKYSKIGGLINIKLEKNSTHCIFSVSDSGPGFTEEDMKKLFNKFQRLSATPTGNESSTGLGLYITKQIIDLHNGKIWVRNNPDVGSTFFIELETEEI